MNTKNIIVAIVLFLLGLFVGNFLRGQRDAGGVPASDISDDLLTVYTTGTLDTEAFTRMGLSDDKRFSLIQYCGHNYQYCQEAHTQAIDDEMIILLFGDMAADYYRHPFVSSLDPVDTLSWLGIGCVESEEEVDQLHDVFYTQAPSSLDDVIAVGVDLGLGDEFVDCVSHGSSLVYIAQSMQKAAQYFDISKTPSYVLIDNQSKHWSLIPGLYGLAEIGEVMTREFDFEGLE